MFPGAIPPSAPLLRPQQSLDVASQPNSTPRPLAMKKLFAHKFSAATAAAGTGTVPRKTLTNPDGSTTSLVALPVLPASPFRTADSRSGIEFSYDALTLIALNAAKGRRLVLDVEHNTENGFSDTRARGWSVSLTTAELEPDSGLEAGVLYGWFELTALGEAELAARAYGYTSGVAMGVWLDESRIQFTRIKSLALTNNPATEMPQTFSASDGITEAEFDLSMASGYTVHLTNKPMDEHMLATLLTALGLAADADEATAVAAITALTAAQAQGTEASVALTAAGTATTLVTEQLTAANAQVTALTATVTAMQAAEVERVAVSAVDAAVAAFKVTGAQRDSMLAFARVDLAAFNAAMAAAVPVVTPGKTPAPAEEALEAAATNLTAEHLAFCAREGIKPQTFAAELAKNAKQLGI